MTLDSEIVRHVLAMARIDATDDEVERFRSDIDVILRFMRRLESPDVSGDSPDLSTGAHAMPLREDGVTVGLSTDDALREALASRGGYFRVPRVPGGEDSP